MFILLFTSCQGWNVRVVIRFNGEIIEKQVKYECIIGLNLASLHSGCGVWTLVKRWAMLCSTAYLDPINVNVQLNVYVIQFIVTLMY